MEQPIEQQQHQHQQHPLMNPNLKPTVDIEAIENQKENIQPIRSGRSAATLVSLFNHHHHHHHHHPTSKLSSTPAIESSDHKPITNFNPIELIEHRKKTHQRFQHQIQVLEDALDSRPIPDHANRRLADELIKDPLEVYLQYIRWTIESYPSGGSTAESRLIPLLEQVTRKFMNDQRYRQDLRYLKCWIFYSDQVNTSTLTTSRSTLERTRSNDRLSSYSSSSPVSMTKVIPSNLTSKLILNFLIHNRIGTKTSLLYLEYFKLFSPLLEGLNHKSDQAATDRFKLESVLKFGISQTSGDDRRLIVDLLDRLRSSDVHPSHNHPDELDQASLIDPGEKTRKLNPKPTQSSKKSKSKTKIKVYEDLSGRGRAGDEGDEEEDREGIKAIGARSSNPSSSIVVPKTMNENDRTLGESPSSSPFSLISKWDSLGTLHSNRKQNSVDPSAWKGQRLPMKNLDGSSPLLPSSSSSTTTTDHGRQRSTTTTTTRSSKIKVYEDHLESSTDEGDTNARRHVISTPQGLVTDQDSQHEGAGGKEEEGGHDDDEDDQHHRKLLDDLLSSEIERQVNSIHELYSLDPHRNGRSTSTSETCQVLKFDPLRFRPSSSLE